MATKSSGTNWAYIIAGGALFFSVASTVISQVSGGTEKLEKRSSKIEDDLAWKYTAREFVAKDIQFIDRNIVDLKTHKVDRDVYEQKIASVDRQFVILREHIKELERINVQTVNTRDIWAALQARILELERITRK